MAPQQSQRQRHRPGDSRPVRAGRKYMTRTDCHYIGVPRDEPADIEIAKASRRRGDRLNQIAAGNGHYHITNTHAVCGPDLPADTGRGRGR